jgi:redox-sensitive bicupin YhaK (pirin superfamily)
MQYIRKSHDRGVADLGWLQSHHTFSFGEYYDPAHMGVSALRVINDDIVQPGKGFGTHGHQDMEIISYVISGAVAHKDSEGNEAIIPAGDVQIMSAGRGIRHSEYNPSSEAETNFLQIWIQPNKKGVKPAYGQMTIESKGTFTPLVTPDGRDNSLSMNQDASLYKVSMVSNEELTLANGERNGYLHIVKGIVAVSGKVFSAGDAFALGPHEKVELEAKTGLEALWFDLP